MKTTSVIYLCFIKNVFTPKAFKRFIKNTCGCGCVSNVEVRLWREGPKSIKFLVDEASTKNDTRVTACSHLNQQVNKARYVNKLCQAKCNYSQRNLADAVCKN